MAEESEASVDVGLKLAGQEVNIKNVKSLNTIATIATLVLVCVLCYAFWSHAEDTRSTNSLHVQAIKEQTSAVREQTQAQRETNCLARFDERDRKDKADFCRQVTR